MGEEDNPIGAYVAAALAIGEVFKFVRSMREGSGEYARRLWLDAYHFKLSENPVPTPEISSKIILPKTVLAGIGAVANGFLHTLYSLPNITGEITAIDGDEEGVTETNLNRYVLFGLSHTKTLHLKASTIKNMFEGSLIKVNAFNIWWQEWRAQSPFEPLDFVISAVDKNSARHAIQDALPRLILGSSTNDMRAQVNLYDSVNGGPCLKCRNRIEKVTPDQVIMEQLRTLSEEQLEFEAKRLCVDANDLIDFLHDPHANCGKIGGTTLQRFANSAETPEWSVGFVSLLAGVLLAAEYLKNSDEKLRHALTANRSMFRFQFWRPENIFANSVVHLPAENSCICRSEAFKKAINAMTKVY